MKVAVIGSGGREHAILWKLKGDPLVRELVAIPGNGGTVRIARSVSCDSTHAAELFSAVQAERPDLVIIGPEAPLANGLADMLVKVQIPCFGPTAAAARIESSKVYAKQIMSSIGVPTAEFRTFDDLDSLKKYVWQTDLQDGWVVKADGLAAGKGVVVCTTREETAKAASDFLVGGIHGAAGKRVVLERRLVGREVSSLYWCDGNNCCPLPPAQDYKRAYDGNQGPNTGGMGAYCPALHLTEELQTQVTATIVQPVLRSLANKGHPYRGILYVGLMLTREGPQVIEFNCRFGDPETQVILPVWKGPFVQTLMDCAQGNLTSTTPIPVEQAAVCVVLAAEGYPGQYQKHIPLKELEDSEYSLTFHAGTSRHSTGIESNGGRVLNAIGIGQTIEEAADRAYDLAGQLQVPGLRFRNDIARSG